jgi:NADPH-dependent curcumin reductase CurA
MSAARSYIPPVEIGEVMRALTAGRVIASRHPGFAPGDWVTVLSACRSMPSRWPKRLQDRGHRPAHGMILLSSAFSVFSET